MMNVSVVIPTYYRPYDLSELLESLLGQVVKPIEVVVVDDSQNDVIRHVCEDYEVMYNKAGIALIYAKNTRARSITTARNLGVKMAKGDLVLFLDSDVIVDPDYVEKVMETFIKYPEALEVAGWMKNISPLVHPNGIRYCLDQTLRKLFFLFHDGENSCGYLEYPIVLTRIINCGWSSGSNFAVKYNIFNEFQFDENLKGYAYMEDVLFSGLIHKRYPKKTFMTPYAKCVHKVSKEGRMQSSELVHCKQQNRKYVQKKLFGFKGLLMFGWQNLGILVFMFYLGMKKWDDVVNVYVFPT